MATDDNDDDAVLGQIGNIGAAMNLSEDETVDPEIRAMAQAAADKVAAKLPKNG